MEDFDKQGKKSAILDILENFVKPEKLKRKKLKIGIMEEPKEEPMSEEECEEPSVLEQLLAKLTSK